MNTLIYLHSGHLGSVSVVTDWQGTQGQPQRQEFDPWGRVRDQPFPPAPPVTSTDFNYTGQKLDDSGLLYYNARYYDPVLGRFVSPDSIVPGVESGKGGAAASVGAYQNHRLTVDFHELGFVEDVQQENALILEKGFWFQLRGEDKQEAGNPWGPANPQSLNRYVYVLNNPLRYTDPTGHTWYLDKDEANKMVDFLTEFEKSIDQWASDLLDWAEFAERITVLLTALGITGYLAKSLTALAIGIRGAAIGVGITVGIGIGWLGAKNLAASIRTLRDSIMEMNKKGSAGVAISTVDAGLFPKMFIASRSTGTWVEWRVGPLIYMNLPQDMHPGIISGGKNGMKTWQNSWHFAWDTKGPGICPNRCVTIPGR